MARLKVGDPVQVVTGDFDEQENTGTIMGLTSQFKDQDGKRVSDPTYQVEMDDGQQIDYKGEALSALET